MTRLLRLLAVIALLLGGSQLLTSPTASAQRADAVVLEASAASVKYAKSLVLTATLAAAQPGAQVDFYAKGAVGAAKVGTETTGDGNKVKVTVPVTRTATYYAVVVVGGVETAQSASVNVVVAPALVLTVLPRLGFVNTFTVHAKPALEGMPVVLQRLDGNKWKTVEKDLTSEGECSWTVAVPKYATSKWRAFVRGSKKYGESSSKVLRVTEPGRLRGR